MAEKQKASTIGLYFNFDQESANALRSRLNGIAARYGYIATRGATAGQGNLSELLLAIDAGEVATVFMSDEMKALIPWLEVQQSATMADHQVYEAIIALSAQLVEAAEREAIADTEEVVSYFHPRSKRQIALQMIERGLSLLKDAEKQEQEGEC